VTPVLATDLDRTLVYSRAAAGDSRAALTAVERYAGRDASWMTAAAAGRFAALHRLALVLPVTTRTPDQYARIRLPGPRPRFAVAANGAILLVDGAADPDWGRSIAARQADVAPLAEVWAHAGRVCRPEWTDALRNAHELFCYAVLNPARLPAGFVAEIEPWAQRRGWQVSLQGRKLYWVPRWLTKSAAVAEVVRRTGAGPVFAAGDSLLDADLLEHAERGIAARHGELVASGWHAPHVTITEHSGIDAGAEIVDWLADRAELRSDRVAGPAATS
jgi:hypothetical protein